MKHYKLVEFLSNLNVKPPFSKVKPPYWRLSGDGSGPGSMARRARDSVATLRRSSACWMPARIGSLSAGVERRRAVTIRKGSLMAGQWGGCEHYGTWQECSASLLSGPGLRWLFATLLLQHTSQSQQAGSGVRRVMSVFCEVTRSVGERWATCPTLLRGIRFGVKGQGCTKLLHMHRADIKQIKTTSDNTTCATINPKAEPVCC